MGFKCLTNFIIANLLFHSVVLTALTFDPYDDKTTFSIAWLHPNDVTDLVSLHSSRYEALRLRTALNEAYTCYIPLAPLTPGEEGLVLSTEDRIQFSESLQPFYLSDRCHNRVEGYWTYEVCHGKQLRQYHKDESKGKKASVVSPDYTLGYFDSPPEHYQTLPLPRVAYSDLTHPYYEVKLSKGSSCDLLGGRGREASVKYICNPHGEHNEFLQIEEISTCYYSVVFGTSFLCRLSAFQSSSSLSEEIQCIAETDSSDSGEPLAAAAVRVAAEAFEWKGVQRRTAASDSTDGVPFKQAPKPAVENMAHKFLVGEICLQGGGTGWWKYEFCYGDYVNQFHVDKSGKQEIRLGTWDQDAHINWFEENRSSNKLVSQNAVLHYYPGGDMCEETGTPRAVVVKMRCVQTGSMEQVTLYLEEPKVCEYMLTVESRMFCQLMENIGDNGLFQVSMKAEQREY